MVATTERSGTTSATPNTVTTLMALNSSRSVLGVINLNGTPQAGNVLFVTFNDPAPAIGAPGWIPLDGGYGNLILDNAPNNKMYCYSPIASLPYTAYDG